MFTDRPTEISDGTSTVRVGAFTVIEASSEYPVSFVGEASIGHHCLITALQTVGSEISIGDRVTIDSRCHVYRGARIGPDTQVLYGAKIFELVEIGARCIVGSDIANWTVLGDSVTFMGLVAHANRRVEALTAWNTEPHPSPTVGDGAFIGERSLLIGGINIGERAYVAAGEVVRCSVPARSVYLKSRITPLGRFRGFIATGSD